MKESPYLNGVLRELNLPGTVIIEDDSYFWLNDQKRRLGFTISAAEKSLRKTANHHTLPTEDIENKDTQPIPGVQVIGVLNESPISGRRTN